MSYNSVTLVGRLTKEPETKQTGKGGTMCLFGMATNGRTKNDDADFHDCVSFGKTAEVIGEYSHKGDQVLVTGAIRYNKYEDKDGNKRTSTSIVVDRVTFLAKKKTAEQSSSGAPF